MGDGVVSDGRWVHKWATGDRRYRPWWAGGLPVNHLREHITTWLAVEVPPPTTSSDRFHEIYPSPSSRRGNQRIRHALRLGEYRALLLKIDARALSCPATVTLVR